MINHSLDDINYSSLLHISQPKNKENQESFMSRHKLTSTIFHQSPIMVADPFELEHNVTGQVSSRNLERIIKILKAFLIRFKMNRFIGKLLCSEIF